MKRSVNLLGLMVVCLLAAPNALGQKGCELNIVGTWSVPDQTNPTFYRFAQDGTVKALARSDSKGSDLREIASANYTLDDPKTPKVVVFREAPGGGNFPLGATAMDITGYDDASLTVKMPGQNPVRWMRLDPDRYFVVLAGRIKTFYDGSGPTFPMLIKTDGRQTQIDAVGTYVDGTYWAFGAIPAETYNQFMKEPRTDSDVMLRLEITAAQYERGLKIVRSWERRSREGALLYGDTRLDNILLAKQITESLNQCGADKIKLYKLDWSLGDSISSSSPRDDNPFSRVPFLYFKELRRINESLHVGDEKFYAATHSTRPN